MLTNWVNYRIRLADSANLDPVSFKLPLLGCRQLTDNSSDMGDNHSIGISHNRANKKTLGTKSTRVSPMLTIVTG